MELASPELPPVSDAVKGTVSTAPTALGAPFRVIVPAFSTDHAYEVRRWQSRGLTVPALDDEVLIVEDESGLPWVVAWWPAGGDAPVPTPAELAAARTLLLARAATTAALPTNTLTGNVLEASANGALAAQDGVTLAVGDRLLNWREGTAPINGIGTASAKHGIYEVTSLGSAGSKWKLTRISTMNESAEVVPGMQVRIAQGTQYGALTFSLLTTGAITLGTTALTFGYASAWVALPGAVGWENYGSEWATAAYRKSSDNRVYLRGLVKHPAALTAGVPSTIGTLPTGFRPASAEIFNFWGQSAAATVAQRVDIKANGELVHYPAVTGVVEYMPLGVIGFYAD